MPQQKGANAAILIGRQADIAALAPAGFLMPINTCNVQPQQNINKPATLTGGRNPVQPFRGNKDVSGSIVVPVDSRAMWYWFQLMFGDPSISGGPPYTHEFKIPTAQPYFTLEQQFKDLDTDKFYQFLGCKIGSFSMEVGGDGELTASMNVLGADFQIAGASFDAAPTDVKSTLDPVGNFQAAIAEGGSSLAIARTLSINLDMDLDGDQYVIGGGGVRGDIPEGIVGVSGQLVVLCKDAAFALIDKGLSVSETSLLLTITDNASSIFEMEIQELEFAVAGAPVDTPRGLVVSLDYQGYLADGSEGSTIVARLTNNDEHA
jgi:hypothetical protein